MNSDTVLDYAQFQLSPRRTRCELFISGGGKLEKLASGLLKPFLTHLKVAEEQAIRAVQSIKLEVEKQKNARTWFNKGTLERFVRFVSTPEVLELVNTFDAEMSQLEGARKIYSQGARDQLSGKLGENESAAAAAADITKKELLRAIDVRLTAIKQDLSTACARASAAGFTLDTVSELVLFADQFGALRLNEACTKFISLCQQRPELIVQQRSPTLLIQSDWKGFDDANIRSSSDSDMSLDEPEGEPPGPFRTSISRTADTGPEFCNPTSGQPPQKSSAETKPSARFLLDKDISKAKEGPSPSTAFSEDPVQPAAGGSRRLSVQDRINLFESKQKEQSVTATISGSSSGGGGVNKVVSVKGEHRRQPSDASAEKSVLRRWSGASDMSIDLTNNINNSFSNDRKESGSAASTPISSDNSQVQSGIKTEEGAGVMKDTAKSWSRLGPKESSATACSSSSLSASQIQTSSFPKDGDRCDDLMLREGTATTSKPLPGSFLVKGHADSQTELFSTSMGRAHQTGFSSETDIQTSSKTVSVSGQGDKLKDHTTSLVQFNCVARQNVRVEDLAALKIPSTAVKATVVKAESNDETGTDFVGVRSQAPSLANIRTFTGKTEVARTKPKVPSESQSQSKAFIGKVEGVIQESDLSWHSQWKTHPENQESGRKKEATVSHMSFKDSLEDDSGSQRMQLHGRISASNQIKLQGRRDERVLNQGTSVPVFSVKRSKELEVLQHSSTPPVEQAQVARPLKGNNELNEELQMKADELEKLFAAHKLRVHEDQTASSRRSRAMDGQTLKSAEKRPEEALADHFSEWYVQSEILSNGVVSHTNLPTKMVDNSDSSSGMKQKLSTISLLDDSKGKLYEKYMQKRDAKLREEWGMKRAEKEAKMKAMHDCLEHSQAEMKAKLAGSSNKRDSILARRHAEKMRSFNVRSAMKNKGQTVEPLQGEENLQELEQVLYGHDRSYSDTLSGNESSASSKKLVSSKSLSSSTPRTTAAPIPKPSVKPVNAGSIRRRTQPENPFAQSVPNFTDTRKENTKPVTGLSKVTSRAQPRTIARGKSATEEAIVVKEEKSRRSHSMRKSLAIPDELKDLSPLISDGANLTPQRFPHEQMEQCVNKDPKKSEVKPFLRKGNGIGPGAGAGLAKLKTSTNPETLKDEEDSEGPMQYREDSPDIVKGNEEEFDRTSAEGNLQATDFPVESDSENGDPGSENGYVLRSESRDVDDPIAESSKYDPSTDNVQESPGGSPGLWNLNSHHSFSYAHEASDIDASVDSPIGSPASWNSHPLNQMMEADAARMRKKWGSAHIPVLAANAPRKDVTKGFKRLLKFGRKSKGAEYLINDWVSASTTSEGDDDTEDGRELGSRTSDELRKSRMGYTVPAYDSFNDGDTFPEPVKALRSSIPNAPAKFKFRGDPLSASSLKAPRSFFSLSSFRSKGGEGKPR